MNSADAMIRSGATYRQLDYWTREGLLHPIGGTGSGFSREWPDAEVAVLRRMVAVVRAGVSPAIAEKAARLEDGKFLYLGAGVRITLGPVEEGDVL